MTTDASLRVAAACLWLAVVACGNDPDAGGKPSTAGVASGGGMAAEKKGGRGGKGGHGGKAFEVDMPDVIPADLHAGDGTARMAARLALLAERSNFELDPTLNVQRAAMFEERLAAAEKAGEPDTQLRYDLALEKLNAGRSEEAISDLNALLADLDARGPGLDPQARLQVMNLLAISWLRVGEQGNCIKHHGTESCLLPISEAGRHMDPSGSRHAMEVLTEILRMKPDDFRARWLFNVAAMTVGDWPDKVPKELLVPPSAFASEQDVGRFTDRAAACGITDRGLAGGVCEEDFDGDGYLDLALSNWAIEAPMHYYRNDGSGKFIDRTAESGLDRITGGLNMLHADYDNDGDADILVTRGGWKAESYTRHPLSLLANDGHGVFRDVTEEAGLLCFLSTQTANFADYDGDGWLDLFVGNESYKKQRVPCRLYHSNRDGTFTEVGAAAGVDVIGYVKACGWGDMDNDGDPDLVLSKMDGPPMLFRNDGGRFTDVTAQSGVAEPPQSFPCWWFDYDNDGFLDIFVSGYRFGQADEVCRDYLGLPHQGVTPRLYRNRGNGTFEDVTAAVGLMHVYPTMGSNFGDLDSDGWPDFYLSTGEPDLRGIYPNRLLRNDQGQRFVDVTTSAGVGHLQKGHGVAFGDLDNDGDQDLFVVMGGAYSGDLFQRSLFENPGHGHHWVTLLLQGTKANRCAIGARIRVHVTRPDGSARDIRTVVGTGGSFGSESLQAEIGLGDATAIDEVEILWPGSGTKQVLKDLPLDRCWRVIEGTDAPVALERHAFKLGGE